MEIAGNSGSVAQDALRQADRSASQVREERQQASVDGARSAPGSQSVEPLPAPEPVGRSQDADIRPRYPSDPDRVTLSQAALQTERRERDDGNGSVIDNDTGEVVSEPPPPAAQNRSAIDAYGAIQNLT